VITATPCITVEWSRPPSNRPIRVAENAALRVGSGQSTRPHEVHRHLARLRACRDPAGRAEVRRRQQIASGDDVPNAPGLGELRAS